MLTQFSARFVDFIVSSTYQYAEKCDRHTFGTSVCMAQLEKRNSFTTQQPDTDGRYDYYYTTSV